jgi:ribonuclease M5
MYIVKETIIVEGIYDKIKLSRFIDAPILVTGGFSVYRSSAMMQTIRKMAVETGVVILTDSDSAGFRIRNYIKQGIQEGRVLHAYVPDIRGKEKRKQAPGKEGLLGVEGMTEKVILDALIKSGATVNGSAETARPARKITKTDMMRLGLAGGSGSRELRQKLSSALGIPMKISANMLLDVLNRLLDYDELEGMIKEIYESEACDRLQQ